MMAGKGATRQPAADDSDAEDAAEAGQQPAAKKPRKAANALTDDRFAAMFADQEFEIDMDSEEYKQLHPNAGSIFTSMVGTGC